jgi:tetratricopeptide (TPR) repeat protein
MLERATRLADRGALFAARDEFLRVLRLIAQSLDADLGRPLHTPALLMGLRALEEAEDFAMMDQHVESDVHLEGFLASHKTPVLRNVKISELTPLLAIQRYYEYAYQHLALSGNKEPLASDALFSLGRIEMLLRESEPDSANGAPKSIAFFNAALTVNPRNGRAANELGVLLAQRGRLEEAHEVLLHCHKVAPTNIARHNLDQVQRRMGITASGDPSLLAGPGAAGTSPSMGDPRSMEGRIQWVDPSTFAKLSEPGDAPGALPLEPIPRSQVQHLPAIQRPPVRNLESLTPRVANQTGTAPSWFGL